MKNNWFDIEIVTTTTKKWNLYIILVFSLFLLISIIINTQFFYVIFAIWALFAIAFLVYDFFHSKSIVYMSTRLLFKDDSFSIISDDKSTNLQISKKDVTQIYFNRKINQIRILNGDRVLYEFVVKPKTLDELIDTFNCFGYKCDIASDI